MFAREITHVQTEWIVVLQFNWCLYWHKDVITNFTSIRQKASEQKETSSIIHFRSGAVRLNYKYASWLAAVNNCKVLSITNWPLEYEMLEFPRRLPTSSIQGPIVIYSPYSHFTTYSFTDIRPHSSLFSPSILRCSWVLY